MVCVWQGVAMQLLRQSGWLLGGCYSLWISPRLWSSLWYCFVQFYHPSGENRLITWESNSSPLLKMIVSFVSLAQMVQVTCQILILGIGLSISTFYIFPGHWKSWYETAMKGLKRISRSFCSCYCCCFVTKPPPFSFLLSVLWNRTLSLCNCTP